jgi:ATP-dependent DNA ligase
VKMLVQNAVIDGEVVCVDAQGVSRFNELMSRRGKPIFYAFDLLPPRR